MVSNTQFPKMMTRLKPSKVVATARSESSCFRKGHANSSIDSVGFHEDFVYGVYGVIFHQIDAEQDVWPCKSFVNFS